MNYDATYRAHVMSVLLRRSFLARFGVRLLKPEYFETEAEQLCVTHIQNFITKYGHPPASLESLLIFAGADGHRIAEVASEAYIAVENQDTDLTLDVVIEFARASALKLALLQSVDDIELGDLDKPYRRIQEAARVGVDVTDIGLDLVTDLNAWLGETHVPKVPTGLWHVDATLRGGLARGELGVVLAPPNRGKSQMLVNIAIGAAGLLYGGDVVYFSMEMSRASVLKRMAARITFRFQDIEEYDADYGDLVLAAAKKRISGTLRVQSYPSRQATVNDVIACMEQLIDAGVVRKHKLVIIVDYADEMRLPKGMELRLGLIDVYAQLRAMAATFDCPVWTASQANREAMSKPVISLQDFAEAFGKAAVADVVVAKCETDDERNADEGRLYLAKVRDEAGAGTEIVYRHYRRNMAIVTTAYAGNTQRRVMEMDDDTLRAEMQKRRVSR